MPDLPSELICRIIEDFDDDLSILKTTSLVCSDLRVFSQQILFRKVSLKVPDADASNAVVERLHNFVSSPRLISYIRDFTLYMEFLPSDWVEWNTEHGAVLAEFLQLVASHSASLQRFTTSGIGREFYGLGGGIPEGADALTSAVEKICEIPSLHYLEMAYQPYLPLHRCGPSLKHLRAASTYSAHRDHYPQVLGRETQIKLESLFSDFNFFAMRAMPTTLEQYLLDPRNLIDLSSVKQLTYYGPTGLSSLGISSHQELLAMLDSCRQSLETFDFHSPGIPYDVVLGLHAFPNLKQLTCRHFDNILDHDHSDGFCWLAQELTGPALSPPKRLEALEISINLMEQGFRLLGPENVHDTIHLLNPGLKSLNKLLSNRAVFPHLRSVVMAFRLPSRGWNSYMIDMVMAQVDSEAVEREMRRHMDSLHNLGILYITWN